MTFNLAAMLYSNKFQTIIFEVFAKTPLKSIYEARTNKSLSYRFKFILSKFKVQKIVKILKFRKEIKIE